MPHPATWPRPVLPRDCRALPAGDRPGGPTHRDAPCRRLPQSWCPASAAGAPHWQRGHCPSLLLMHCPKLVVFFFGFITCPKPFPTQPPSPGKLGAAAWGSQGTTSRTSCTATRRAPRAPCSPATRGAAQTAPCSRGHPALGLCPPSGVPGRAASPACKKLGLGLKVVD